MVTPCFVTSGQFATESRIPPHDNVADDSKTAPFEYCAAWRSVSSIVDDSLCDPLLFGVKPHSRYETSNVAHASESLPIDSATEYAV
ncbi:hypothetical protein TNCV_1894911 [Trichonephila clavipes]|nr:hypothetical protein TNCV_1894911 [Trichonephila clavipes]